MFYEKKSVVFYFFIFLYSPKMFRLDELLISERKEEGIKLQTN